MSTNFLEGDQMITKNPTLIFTNTTVPKTLFQTTTIVSCSRLPVTKLSQIFTYFSLKKCEEVTTNPISISQRQIQGCSLRSVLPCQQNFKVTGLNVKQTWLQGFHETPAASFLWNTSTVACTQCGSYSQLWQFK